jgi:hypothetical protein
MTAPRDGDFASYLNQIAQRPDAAKTVLLNSLGDREQTQYEYDLHEDIPDSLLDEQQKLSKELMREAAELQVGGADLDPNTTE